MKTRTLTAPREWKRHVRSAILQVVSLAHWSIVYTRSWCADSLIARVRLAGKLDQAAAELALLREELRIKDSRMARIPPKHRPFYQATERLAILELKAARGWNLAQTARVFMLEPETVASWLGCIDDEDADALVRLSEPQNKFPDFVRYIVRRMRVLCPTMGKKRIADILARAGLHLAATTAGRFLKARPLPPPQDAASDARTRTWTGEPSRPDIREIGETGVTHQRRAVNRHNASFPRDSAG